MIITPSKPYFDTLEVGQILNINILSGSVLIVGHIDGEAVIRTSSTTSTTLGPYLNNINFEVNAVGGNSDVFESKTSNLSAEIQVNQATNEIEGIINPKTGILESLNKVFYLKSIPVGISPNGAIDAAGNLTLVAALNFLMPHVWMYFPAGAVLGGLAGMYYVRMTTTTVGTVYTNFNNATTTDFEPFIPESPVLAVGSNVAYTSPTAQVNIFRKTLPANSMGKDGKVRFSPMWTQINNASSKVLRIKFGGLVDVFGASSTTSSNYSNISSIQNQGVTNSQFGHNGNNGDIGIAGARSTMSEDTTLPVPIVVTAQIAAAATDHLFMTSLMIEVFPQS
jgi:hypothetical protein